MKHAINGSFSEVVKFRVNTVDRFRRSIAVFLYPGHVLSGLEAGCRSWTVSTAIP